MKNIITLSLLIVFSFCRKQYDHPDFKTLPESTQLKIGDLRKRLHADNSYYKFGAGDTSLYCTVTADETSGNIFRQVFVRDDNGDAIQLKLASEGGLFTGDRIRINLNSLYLVCADNMIYIDSVNLEKNCVKISSGHAVTPKVCSMAQLAASSGEVLNGGGFQAQLVEINNVEFEYSARNKNMADAVTKQTVEHNITDCAGRRIVVRTSGRSNFASKPVPQGNGKMIAIVSQFGNTMQLLVRNYNDLKMDNKRCTGPETPQAVNPATFVLAVPVSSVSESFGAAVQNATTTPHGWINYNETGTVMWRGNIKNSQYYAFRASAYQSTENSSAWFISPPVTFQSHLRLSFKTGAEFWIPGHQEAIAAFISTDFKGDNFSKSNWKQIDGLVYADGSGINYNGASGLVPSGEIQLKNLEMLKNYSGTFFIAFRYKGTPGHTSNIYIDDIEIK